MSYECCEGVRGLKFSRGYFLKQGGVAMIGLSAMPAFLQRAAAATPMPNKKQLVVLFQRGAADGLNIVMPFGESNYYRMRPTIAIPQPKRGSADAAIDLDGFFGLHPSLAPLEPLFHKNQLAIVQGAAPAIALPDLKQFKVMAQAPGTGAMVEGGFEAMYAQTVDKALQGTGSETFEAIDLLRKADPAKYQPENGAQYPTSRLGQSLQQIGQLLKADIGVEVLFVDCGGWDNHVNEGGVQGQLSNLLRDLGQGLAAFHQDLADRMQNIVFVTMSEFGRTARENGNRGTDHGHANCMFVMGGDVPGGQVYGKWPGLNDHQLNEGRDLALSTDFRSVLGEILTKHIGVADLKPVFPGFDNHPRKFPGLIRA